MGNGERGLLENLKKDLNTIVFDKEVFQKTQADLNQFCEDHSGTFSIAELEDIFEDCYHELVSLENKGPLTIEQTALLTDLDELEDYWVHKRK